MNPLDAPTATASEGNAFRGREHIDDGVLFAWRLCDPAAEAAPQIDHLAAIPIDPDSSAHVLTTAQVSTEDVDDLSVPLVDVSANEIRRNPWVYEQLSGGAGEEMVCLRHHISGQ